MHWTATTVLPVPPRPMMIREAFFSAISFTNCCSQASRMKGRPRGMPPSWVACALMAAASAAVSRYLDGPLRSSSVSTALYGRRLTTWPWPRRRRCRGGRCGGSRRRASASWATAGRAGAATSAGCRAPRGPQRRAARPPCRLARRLRSGRRQSPPSRRRRLNHRRRGGRWAPRGGRAGPPSAARRCRARGAAKSRRRARAPATPAGTNSRALVPRAAPAGPRRRQSR
ncbi:hypothetical protein M885DRAFT_201465 [Pelagophyceae sp. CCMP2097]|nr:hypothetical protein M885DRAFT_201465 [Pelagophyceae sp. CCMP2097]